MEIEKMMNMTINLNSLLPDTLSDEAAYHVTKIFFELAMALDDYYTATRKNYSEKISSQNQENEDVDIWGQCVPF